MSMLSKIQFKSVLSILSLGVVAAALSACGDPKSAESNAKTEEGSAEEVTAKGMEFFHGSFEEALAKAKEDNKLVFVDAYTTWCGPCKMMVLNVFPQPKVGEFYNANFVNLKLDTEDEDQNGPELADKYGVEVLPTYYYIKPDGSVQHKATGYIEADRFIAEGKEALGEEYDVFPGMKERYQAGDRDSEFVQQYLAEAVHSAPGDRMSQERRAHQIKMKKIFDTYISGKEKQSLINKEDFGLMKSYLKNSGRDNEYVDFVANNYDAFLTVAPESQVAFFLLDEVKASVSMTASAGDASYVKYIEELDGLLARAYKCQLEVIKNEYVYKEYLEMLGKRAYGQATQDWGQMLKDVQAEIAAKGDSLTASDYVRFAGGFWQCNDQDILKKALGYAKTGYDMEPSARSAMGYVGLLQKMGDNEQALTIAEKTLAAIDKNSKDANFKDIFNQIVAELKEKQ